MAPHQPTHSPQQAEDEQTPLHPLLRGKSQVEDLLNAAAKRKEHKEFQIEELERWKDAVNGLAASPNGRLFLQSMIKFTGLFEPANRGDATKMVDSAVKATFYLKWVRPFLNPDLRSTIE